MQAINSHAEKIKDLVDFTAGSTSYSPFSIMHALLLLTYCSDDASIDQLTKSMQITRQELLDFSNQLKLDKSVALASNIFSKNIQGVNPAFSKLMKETFGFTPEKLKSAAQVNKWCAKHTDNRIDHLINNADFEAILLSAIHFKADWAVPFEARDTTQKEFSGFSAKAGKQMMQMTKHLQFAETESAYIVNLKYENSNLSAQIILPKGASKQDFNAALSQQNLNPVFQSTRVHLQLPKFKINSEFKLKPILQKLNVTKIFERIDCTNTLGQILFVEEVIQKTFVEVDEKGTEAAAVTGIIMNKASFFREEKPVEVNCDRPFWFVLKGSGGEVVFVNSVVD
ncbi:Serpin_1 [Hexamita inflata]|uniref:Serpin 1 n=1 Tax=Hexamita inflata TaxID=28002 RepID=A0AA86RIG8_9EUKA|nr:Serpin 1 [Hexamita inflata]